MSGICICFTRRSETPTKEAYRILNRYDYIAKLWINGKSCAQLPIALPQVLTKSGSRRTATTLKKWVHPVFVWIWYDLVFWMGVRCRIESCTRRYWA